jgi:hypothetical protein
MKKHLMGFIASLAVMATAYFVAVPHAHAQMNNPGAPGNVTAGNGLAQVGQVISINAPVSVANGGTNSTSASGTALDNISGFSSTGFLTRTGAGAYSFQSLTNGITLGNLAQGAANTVLANATGATANYAAFSMPSCSSTASALTWTSGTGFGCNTAVVANNVSGTVAIANGGTGATTATNALANLGTQPTNNPVWTGNVGVFSQVMPSYPVTNYPEGNDMRLTARGPADWYDEHLKAATTTTATITAGTQTVTVGAVTVSNLIRGVEQTGTTALFSTQAGLIIGRETANEEVVSLGNWSIVSATQLSITFAKSHSGTTDIEQLGIDFDITSGIEVGSGELNPSQLSGRSAPLRLYDSNLNVIAYLPANESDPAPYNGVQWNAEQFGANGTNKNLVFRDASSASAFQVINAANSGFTFTLDDSGDGAFAGAISGASLSVSGVVNGLSGIESNGVQIKPVLAGTSGSIGGSVLAAGQCSSGSLTITGATTGMVASVSPVSYPGDGNWWEGIITGTNSIVVKVCASYTNTPTATAYNVRILQ